MKTKEMDRRNFIKRSAMGVAGAGLFSTGFPLRGEQETPDSPLKIKNYRTLGRTGFRVSDISSGMPQNEAILGQLLDTGVNYIDTASDFNQGYYERIAGNVIKNRDRKSLFVTTKIHLKGGDSKESVLQRTEKCLERLQTDYLDCMLIHGCGTVDLAMTPGFHDAMGQLKKEGKVRFIGVSNHGTSFPGAGQKTDSMEKVLTAAALDGRFDVILMVYNFLTKESSERILRVCQEKNIGVTLMKVNPVSDYLMISDMIKKLEDGKQQVPAFYEMMKKNFKAQADQMMAYLKMDSLKNPGKVREAAIRFVLSHPAVHSVCCTCHSFDDVENFVKLSGMRLTGKDKNTLAAYEQGFGKLYCRHACGICESKCPRQVPVNKIMRYNHYFVSQGREKEAMEKYQKLAGHQADVCSQCRGFCEAACPHNVHVHALLNLAHQRLSLA